MLPEMNAALKVGVEGLAGGEEVDRSLGVQLAGDHLQTVGGEELQPALTNNFSSLLLPVRMTTLNSQS